MPRLVGLGQASASPAGEINGIALLTADLRSIAARASEFMPSNFRFSRSKFDRMMATFKRRSGESDSDAVARVRRRYATMTGEEVATLVAGTVGVIGSAVVRAKSISLISVSSPEARADSHRIQASLIDPARLMWQMLSEMVSNMEARQEATGGLGLATVVIVALIVAGAVLGVAALAAAVYLGDSWGRVVEATRTAQAICERRGGCSAAEEARIRTQLQVGPFDAMLREFGASAGKGVGTGITIAAVGGSVAVAALGWYYLLGGKKWIAKRWG